MSQKELAHRIGIALWTLDRIERGDQDAGPHLDAIAEATRYHPELLREWPADAVSAPPDDEAASGAEHDSVAAPSEWVRNIIMGSIALLVVIRFFTEDISVLPNASKFVDIPILAVLFLMSALAPRDTRLRIPAGRYFVIGLAFLAACTLSVLVNSGRIEPAPALLFIYGFLAPVVVFYLVWQLWPTGQALSFSRLLVALAVLEFAVVLAFDVPDYFRTKNPDVVSGTFGENAYQLVFFLLVCSALVAGIVAIEPRRLVGRFAPFFFAAAIGTILLAQYRAILLAAAGTVLLVATLLGLVRVRGALVGVLIAVVFAAAISVIPSVVPELKLQDTIDTLTGNPTSYVSERIDAGGDIATLYTDDPDSILAGTGPGTFNSRAWETFYDPTESGSIGIAIPFAPERGVLTDVSEKYTIPRLREQETTEGSFALATPFASYFALLAEVGLIGFLLLVALYVRAFVDSVRMSITALRIAPKGDPIPALMLASCAGFFVILQMGILSNWWEVARVTFVLWILFAVASKEFQAKYGMDARGRVAA